MTLWLMARGDHGSHGRGGATDGDDFPHSKQYAIDEGEVPPQGWVFVPDRLVRATPFLRGGAGAEPDRLRSVEAGDGRDCDDPGCGVEFVGAGAGCRRRRG